MKILIICAFVVAVAQAFDSIITYREATESARDGCLKEKGLHGDMISDYYKPDYHPDDDPVFLDFYGCYWRSMGIIRDGEFDYEVLKVLVNGYIRDHFREVSEEDAVKIGDAAIDHCKGRITGDSIEQQSVRYRNCLLRYIKNNVHH